MTKTRIIIYTTFLSLILLALFFAIFCLIKKETPQKQTTEITPVPITEISWSEAVNFVQTCQIQTVFQKHNLEVTLTHKDGRILKTIEPKIDDIFIETNHLRSDCNDIIQTISE